MYNKLNNNNNPFLMAGEYYCQYCGKKCKNLNSLKQHEIRCKKNPNHIQCTCLIPLDKRGWSKGLTAQTDSRVANCSMSIKNHYVDHPGTYKGRKHTTEQKQKIAKSMVGNTNWLNSLGKTGFGKKGWYKGIHCDSTYELAFVVYCLDHNIDIKRSRQTFKYEYKGKIHTYYPDFEVNNSLVEIKGYWQQRVDAKIQAVKNTGTDIKIYYPKDLIQVFEYIYQKYHLRPGPELTKLYDK